MARATSGDRDPRRPSGNDPRRATGQKTRKPRTLLFAGSVGRAPGNICYRCFLSNLTGLAVRPPPGLALL